MSDWHPRPAAQIGLRLVGLGLIACLGPIGQWLCPLVRQSGDVTGLQCLLGAASFVCASLGAMLLALGPDLWKPVAVAGF